MIEEMYIENFESHEDTELVFSPGLNVFIGETDRGKSGVFRAHKLVATNKPGGEWMRPLFWEGDTVITEVYSGPDFAVTRTKGKAGNTYMLNDEEPVNAGTSVPANIAVLLDIGDVNLQTQVERAFMMFETSGERGRILNGVAGLDEIDKTLDNAKRDVNSLNGNWEREKTNTKTIQTQLDSFPDIEAMENDVLVVETIIDERGVSVKKVEELSLTLEYLENVEKAVLKVGNIDGANSMLNALNTKITARNKARAKADELEGILSGLEGVEISLNSENYDGAEKVLRAIQDKMDMVTESKNKVKKIERILSQLAIIDKKSLACISELEELENQIPNICSECGREL